MSEIQRYRIPNQEYGFTKSIADPNGYWCLASDLLWYQRQYRMAMTLNIVVVLVCGILAALLVTEKSSHGPAPVPTMAQRHADEQIGLAEAQYQANKVEVDKLRRNLDQVSGKLDGALRLNANLKAQIHELNKLTDPSQQVDALRVAAAKMHDGQVAALAREMGFTKVKVTE